MKEKRLCLQVEEEVFEENKKDNFLGLGMYIFDYYEWTGSCFVQCNSGYSCNIIIFLLYTSALFIWISQVKRRLLQNEECKFLSGVAALMLFLMAVRTIKFDFLPSGSVYARYAWYLYYVPQTLAVLWMFFAVLYIGKPYHYQLERKWRILYIPAFILIGGIYD